MSSIPREAEKNSQNRTPSRPRVLTARIDELKAEIKLLLRAAERVCWFDWSSNDADAVTAIDDLRKLVK